MKVDFVIQGKAQAKQRPRFNTHTGRTYTPNKTINYENWVKICYLEKYKDKELMDKPLRVTIRAFLEIPKSTSKKKKQQMLDNEILPMVKPDTDNIAKSILDSLNGIAYKDDKQVAELIVYKFYNDTPYVNVTIEEID
nr:MAG TPA: Endodeoxyribonuclease RusA [Caudoviricetes sp.]